jgi:hypothetical protein
MESNELLARLYFALSVNHNFDQVISAESAKWQAWEYALAKEYRYLNRVIKAIERGELLTRMGKRNVPNLQDVRGIIRDLKRHDRGNGPALNAPVKREMSDRQVREMLDKALIDGRAHDYSSVDFNHFTGSYHNTVDNYITRISGVKPKS